MVDMSWIDPEMWMDKLFTTLYTIVKIPFGYWNNLPEWVHWTGFGLICLLTLLFFWVYLKSKDEWKYRA